MFLAIYIWFCSSGLKQFGKFQNHTAWIWKQWLGSLALKIIFCTTRVRDETFRNGKRYEDKIQSLPSPYKVWENFFVKKLCIREQTFWGKIMGGCFTQWLMIRSCKEGEKSTLKIADWIWKTPYSNFLWGWGFHVEPVFFFKKDLVLTCSFMSWCLFRFTYLWARLMEKWVKTLHSESEGSYLKPSLPVTLGSYEYQEQWLASG